MKKERPDVSKHYLRFGQALFLLKFFFWYQFLLKFFNFTYSVFVFLDFVGHALF